MSCPRPGASNGVKAVQTEQGHDERLNEGILMRRDSALQGATYFRSHGDAVGVRLVRKEGCVEMVSERERGIETQR